MTIKEESDKEIVTFTTEDPTPGRDTLYPSQRRKNIVVIAFSSFLAGSANMVHFTFYNPYFLEIKDSEKLIGIISTAAAFVAIVGLVISDYLNGIFGYKRVYLIAQILIASSFVFFIFRPSAIIWVIVAALLLNFAFSLNESPAAIILTETAGEEKKGKVSSLTYFFGKVGELIVSSIIPAIGLLVSFTNKERSFFYTYSAAIYAAIALLVLFFIVDPSKVIRKKETEEEIESDNIKITENTIDEESPEIQSRTTRKTRGFIGGFIDTFRDKWVLRVALTFFTDAVLWSIALGVHIPGLLDEDPLLLGNYHLEDDSLSMLFLATNIVVLIGMFPAGWLADKVGAKTLLFSSELCGLAWAVLVIVFVFFPQYFWIMIVARVALGLSIALWIPSTIALFTNVEAKRKSKVYNSIAIFRTIGWLPGGVIAGFLYDAIPQPYGFLTPIFILITGMFVIVPLFYTLTNKPPNGNNTEIKS